MEPSRAERVRELSRQIDEKQAEAARLAHKLTGALAVQAIWPEAFKGGQRCTRCTYYAGYKLKPKPKRYFLRRADGVEFDLTREQYEMLAATD